MELLLERQCSLRRSDRSWDFTIRPGCAVEGKGCALPLGRGGVKERSADAGQRNASDMRRQNSRPLAGRSRPVRMLRSVTSRAVHLLAEVLIFPIMHEWGGVAPWHKANSCYFPCRFKRPPDRYRPGRDSTKLDDLPRTSNKLHMTKIHHCPTIMLEDIFLGSALPASSSPALAMP